MINGRPNGEGDPLGSGDAGVPRYRRLARILASQISSGKLAPGDALPPERRLADMYRVSRVTVRRALESLNTDGLIEQRHGSGSFVAGRLSQQLSVLTSFTDEVRSRGMAPESVVLDRSRGRASPEEAIGLGLKPGEAVSRISRLRKADGAPLAIENATVVARVLPDPSAIRDSLYACLAERDARPVRAIQRLCAVGLDGTIATHLEVADGTPGLFIVRVSYLSNGTPIEYTRSYYRGDRWDFVAELV